jgi:hypothetical protein
MRKIPKATYQTPEEVYRRIQALQAHADEMQPGNARQSVLVETAKLRAYADMKRWASAAKPSEAHS